MGNKEYVENIEYAEGQLVRLRVPEGPYWLAVIENIRSDNAGRILPFYRFAISVFRAHEEPLHLTRDISEIEPFWIQTGDFLETYEENDEGETDFGYVTDILCDHIDSKTGKPFYRVLLHGAEEEAHIWYSLDALDADYELIPLE